MDINILNSNKYIRARDSEIGFYVTRRGETVYLRTVDDGGDPAFLDIKSRIYEYDLLDVVPCTIAAAKVKKESFIV